MTYAIIDADSIYFRAAYVTKKTNEIRKIVRETMLDIEAQTWAEKMLVAVKGRGNFRKDLYPEYKKNRKDLEPDMKKALTYAHEFMVGEYDAKPADGMEADDLVSIWAYETREQEIPYCVVGIDKDLKQIPGNHYNFKRKEHVFMDDDASNLSLMQQCITGDSTDNIPGVKGLGPVKAGKLLAGISQDRRWNRVRAVWRANSAGCPKLSRRLLEMLTSWEEFDGIKAECEAIIGKQDVLQEQKQDS